MKPKNILLLLVIIALGLAVWYFVRPEKTVAPTTEETETNQQSQQPGDDETVVEEVPNAMEGELMASNDKRRGNLMLLLKDSDRIIYLNTSRDFSQLIGKNVSVSIEGSLDDFRLLDIKAQ